jgi:hypothetical protein
MRYAKAGVAIAAAGVAALIAVVSDGVTVQEWLQVGVAVLTALGVYLAPYAKEDEPPKDPDTPRHSAG